MNGDTSASARRLAPMLKGFSPTPEMPEIAERRALLEALSDTDDATARGAAAKFS